MKTLGGLAILGGGVLTMTIPRFPLFWIGGIIFGSFFIFNGIKQWLKILSLDRDSGQPLKKEKLEQGNILICKHCGTKNRVPNYSSKLRPVCGKCKTALSEPFHAVAKRLALRLKPVWLVPGLIVAAVGLIIYESRPPTRDVSLVKNQQPKSFQKEAEPVIWQKVAPKGSKIVVLQKKEGREEDKELQKEYPQRPRFDHPPQILPLSGIKTTYFTEEAIAPLTIVTRRGTGHYFVKIVDWYNDRIMMTLFIRSGEPVGADLPIGSYKIKYATGDIWYGENHLFGPDTAYSMAEKRFDFLSMGDHVSGYNVELFLQPNGNLRTKRISQKDF